VKKIIGKYRVGELIILMNGINNININEEGIRMKGTSDNNI
jgi:hypothetical protein